MNFLLDQDVPERIGDVLRQEGHSIICLREVLPMDSEDSAVLKYASEHEIVLITCNRDDFLELARQIPHYGLIIVIRRKTRLAECAAVLSLVRRAGESGLHGNINFA